MKQQS